MEKSSPITALYVVGIGASAGGLEAIHEFFDKVPPDTQMAFVIVQHLSSDYKSLLVELVSKHTHMTVAEATDGLLVEAACVYVIPNNKLMTLADGKLRLTQKIDKVPNAAIDHFLFSLAADQGAQAIAIILSGTGNDGTKGIEAVKECGGMVIVQTPETAKFDGMPVSAVESGNADFIVPTAEMYDQLAAHVSEEPVQALENGEIEDGDLNELFDLVHAHTNQDFAFYKTPTILRRIGRRMQAAGIPDIKAYIQMLREDPDESTALGKDFLIGVTRFFRDEQAFQVLKEKVFPELVSQKTEEDQLKVWICACSTGEEAYSIAILLNEYLQHKGKNLDVKIFASDLDEASIDIAARNAYPSSVEKQIPSPLFKKYFIKDGNRISVVPHIRKQIVFAKHNVIKSPPFIKNDLVCCRNMLIYMNTILQHKVLTTLHFALNIGGILFLGPSETIAPIREGVTDVSSKWKIYRKSGPVARPADFSYGERSVVQRPGSPVLRSAGKKSADELLQRFLLAQHGFVGVFVDRNFEVKETIGDYKRFLSLPDQRLEVNLLKMVPKELSFLLNNTIRSVWKEPVVKSLKKIRVRRGQEELFINIDVSPAAEDAAKPYTLVVFNQVQTESETAAYIVPISSEEQQHGYVLELESELTDVRNNLQMAVEEMETTNEELQSSNEELLSANEELQSSNEELQSLNEELHTLNTEHQQKIRELVELNDDLNNYFKSVEIGQIFVDGQARIRKFNPAAVEMVNLIEADIGRPIAHISNNIRYDQFLDDIKLALRQQDALPEKEIELKTGRVCLMRILPYTRLDGQKDGVVITFIDVSALNELNNMIAGVFKASLSAVFIFKAMRNGAGQIQDFQCLTANTMAESLILKKSEELTGLLLQKQLPELLQGKLYDQLKGMVESGLHMQTEVRLENQHWYIVMASRISDVLAVTYTDVTERKTNEQNLKKNYNELISARESLRNLNNQLEDRIQERTLSLTKSEDRFNLVAKATNDTIWDWDLVNNTIWRSDNFQTMFGYERSPQAERTGFWFDRIHPDDRERVRNSVYESINESDEYWSAEYRFAKADNTYVEILDRGSIQRDAHGTPYRMVGSVVDVTRIKEAERKAGDSQNRFRKVFESNVIGMLFSDMGGRVLDANSAFLQLLGYDQQAVTSGELTWKKMITPEEYSLGQLIVTRLKEGGYYPPVEREMLRQDGTKVPVLMGAAKVDEQEQEQAVTYIIDISKQKAAEEKRQELQDFIVRQQKEFYELFVNAPALISIRRGKSLHYEFTNDAFNRFYAGHDFTGLSTAQAHRKMPDDQLYQGDTEILATGLPLSGQAFMVKRFDRQGNELGDAWLDFLFTPVYDEQEQVDGIAFFGFEVTELIKAQRATRALMQRKDEFMSIASHELKTPITSLKGALQIGLQLTRQDKPVAALQQFLERGLKQTDKLTALINDLLDVTKIHAGKLQLNYSRFDLDDMVREAIEDFRINNHTHQILFEHDGPVRIEADRHRLEQVLINLLSNAVKYSPGKQQVVVNVEPQAEQVKVSVKDFGIGIPENKKELVFDRFFRVQETNFQYSGLGLGLFISKDIIERHQGHIGVSSVEDEGTTFWFVLPLNN